VLLAALLLTAPQALAGEHVRAARQPSTPPQPPPAPVVRVAVPPVTITLTALAAVQAATETASINLRGPDGQLRRFPVEGGAAEMPSRVVILRPGESLTIQWTAKK
jgi:hypothetical protein